MKRGIVIALGVGSLVAIASLAAGLAFRQPGGRVVQAAPSPYRGSVPPPGIRAPEFTLPDYRGTLITMSALRGSVVVLSFVDSKCKESCPIVAGVIARAVQQLPTGVRHDVVPLLMSVNPNLDTPPSIHRFLARRRALMLRYLVGTVAQMRPIWKAYGVLPAVDTGNADVHSSDVRIFDRTGIWVSTQHPGVDLTAANLEHDVLLALEKRR